MTNDQLIYKDPDSLLRLTLRDGEARVLMVRTTRMAQEAADIHMASDTAAAAIGRLLAACAMTGALLKEQNGRLTVTVSGDGAGGRMTCGVQAGRLKIAVANPQAELPPLPDGKLDVAGFVGRRGQLAVVKDYGAGEPFTSLSNLVSGELGEDFASYFTLSEQIPSLVALGCLNGAGTVLSSGGMLIQAMPGCSAATLDNLENRIPFFANISREIYDRPIRGLAEAWLRDMNPVFLAEDPLELRCDCSRMKMLRALSALNRKELEEMRDSGEPARMTCHFCRTVREFDAADIGALLRGETMLGTD